MYRIITKERKIKFAGTDIQSWFMTIEDAKRYMSDTDSIYEYNCKGERLWEVL